MLAGTYLVWKALPAHPLLVHRMPRRPDPLATFHPLVRRWFRERLGAPSAPQREGWPAIASGAHTLILAPTGTGKTLAAFLWELNALIVDGLTAREAAAERVLEEERGAPSTAASPGSPRRRARSVPSSTASRT